MAAARNAHALNIPVDQSFQALIFNSRDEKIIEAGLNWTLPIKQI